MLCLWKLESYLADGKTLEFIQAGLNKKRQRPLSDVYQELLDHCHSLIPHAAINAVLQLNRRKGIGDGFKNKFGNQEQVNAFIRQTTIPKLPENAQTDYETHLRAVIAFDSANGTPVNERVKGLLRRIHGKALLQRFLNVSHKIQVDVKGLLANRIKEKACIPSEIDRFI